MSLNDGQRDLLGEGGFETLCAHYAEHRLMHGGAVAPPLYQTSTFVFPDAEAFERRDLPQNPYFQYSRKANPTTRTLEAKLAKLERGNWARAFSSGMGAITCAINALTEAGTHVVAVANAYHPTRRYLEEYLKRFNISVTFVSGTRTEDFIAAMRDDTRVLYLESPTTGYFEVLDVPGLSAAARERGVRTVFDNSWASPYFQQPLEHGCDIVVHSATKYISGHSDVVAGMVVGRDAELGERIAREGELLGASIDPFAAWLLLRGIRTLSVRMERHQENGLAVARLLAEDERVAVVHHPGLDGVEQHELAARQMSGYASLFSFALKDQSREATHRFLDRLKLFGIGVSWGGFESLAIGGLLFNRDDTRGQWLIRLSVGLETRDDLVADVRQALEG